MSTHTELPMDANSDDVQTAIVEDSTNNNPELNMDLLLDRVAQYTDSAWGFTSYEEYDMVVKKPHTDFVGMKADFDFSYKNHDVYIYFK